MNHRGYEGATPERRPGPYTGSVAELARALACHRRLLSGLARRPGVTRFQIEVVESVAALLGTDRVFLSRPDPLEPDFLRVVAGTGPLAHLEGVLLPASESFEGSALRTDGVVVRDERAARGAFFSLPEYERSVGPALAVRLDRPDGGGSSGTTGEVIGILLAARPVGSVPFTPSEAHLLMEIAAPVAELIHLAEQLVTSRDSRAAVDQWREGHTHRQWLETHRGIAFEREEAVFRLPANDGSRSGRLAEREVFWETGAPRLLGTALPLPATVGALLGRLDDEGRNTVEAGLHRVLEEPAPAMLSAACEFEHCRGKKKPVRARIWRLREGEGLVGVITPENRASVADTPTHATSRSRIADPVRHALASPWWPGGSSVKPSASTPPASSTWKAEPWNSPAEPELPPPPSPLPASGSLAAGSGGRAVLEAWLSAFSGADTPGDAWSPAPTDPAFERLPPEAPEPLRANIRFANQEDATSSAMDRDGSGDDHETDPVHSPPSTTPPPATLPTDEERSTPVLSGVYPIGMRDAAAMPASPPPEAVEEEPPAPDGPRLVTDPDQSDLPAPTRRRRRR